MNADELQENLPESLQDVKLDDKLAVIGLLAGVFLVLAGLGTVAGTPWTTKASIAAAGVQVLGALATAGVGVGIIWLTQR